MSKKLKYLFALSVFILFSGGIASAYASTYTCPNLGDGTYKSFEQIPDEQGNMWFVVITGADSATVHNLNWQEYDVGTPPSPGVQLTCQSGQISPGITVGISITVNAQSCYYDGYGSAFDCQ